MQIIYIVAKNHVKAQELLQQNKEKNKETEVGYGSSNDSKEDDFQCSDDVDEITPIAPISQLNTSSADEVMDQNQELASVSEASNYVVASSASTVTTTSQGDSVLSTVATSIV